LSFGYLSYEGIKQYIRQRGLRILKLLIIEEYASEDGLFRQNVTDAQIGGFRLSPLPMSPVGHFAFKNVAKCNDSFAHLMAPD